MAMKVLQVIRSLDPSGGGPMEVVRQISPELQALGVETDVACLDAPGSAWFDSYPLKVVPLGPVSGKFGYRRGVSKELRRVIGNYDAVVVHGIWQYHGLAVWRALRGLDIPYYVYPHGMLDPWFKRTYPLKHLKKWIYWPWVDFRVLRDARAVLFTAERERVLARESFWLYQVREVVAGLGTSPPPEGAEEQRRAFLGRWPELAGKRLWLYLSRIHPKKGTDLLIEAFAAVAGEDPQLELVIAGPDQVGWQGELEQRAKALGISERIHWTGMVSGDLKWGAFRSAELFCLPSHQENFGIAVAEALACGVPVAIGEPVNIATEVEEAGAGLVHADTLAGTTAAYRRWLALGAEERRAMGTAAAGLFAEKFHIRAVAKRQVEILTELGFGKPC